jgi:LEA14-like dessication related protein
MSLSYRTWVSAAVLAISLGCGGAAPQLKVLGVTEPGARTARTEADAHTMVLFLEVVNPSELPLELSRLSYRFQASPWFEAVGEIALSRAVGADSAEVVEVPVRLSPAQFPSQAAATGKAGDMLFSLDGRLFARAGGLERSWNVALKGRLPAGSLAGKQTGPRVRMRLASGH